MDDFVCQRTQSFPVHPGLSWVEIESTAVEIDRCLEVFTIAVAADSSLD